MDQTEKTHVTVHIGGQEFRLSAEENEAYICRIAEYVNTKIDELQRAYPTLSTGNCALLAALNISDELHKLREDYDALDSRISQLREMPRMVTPVKRPFETQQESKQPIPNK
ncbi:MAG: cell division protein ZapA [Christensenellaceae bacterium]|jgi:cell division protein ZapA|nr:cell division protein ZapA [Christensenellaceae bacterium]